MPGAPGLLPRLACSLFSEVAVEEWDGPGSKGRPRAPYGQWLPRDGAVGMASGSHPRRFTSPATAESAVCPWPVLPGQLGKLEPLSWQSQYPSRIGLSLWQLLEVACGFYPKLMELVKTEVSLFFLHFTEVSQIFTRSLHSVFLALASRFGFLARDGGGWEVLLGADFLLRVDFCLQAEGRSWAGEIRRPSPLKSGDGRGFSEAGARDWPWPRQSGPFLLTARRASSLPLLPSASSSAR